MAIEVKAKKWGNSVGVVIPAEIVDKLKIKPEQNILIEVHKAENPLKELFGVMKFKKDTDVILKEVRRELESKWEK